MTMENKMTAVEYIEEGIKARQTYWHDRYQQGYQRALSEIMELYIEEAKQMEKDQIVKAVYEGMSTNFDPNMGRAEQYYNETYKK